MIILLPLVYSCTSVNVSLHHWDDENETPSGRRTADSEGKTVPSAQPGGGKAHSASTPHRSVSAVARQTRNISMYGKQLSFAAAFA